MKTFLLCFFMSATVWAQTYPLPVDPQLNLDVLVHFYTSPSPTIYSARDTAKIGFYFEERKEIERAHWFEDHKALAYIRFVIADQHPEQVDEAYLNWEENVEARYTELYAGLEDQSLAPIKITIDVYIEALNKAGQSCGYEFEKTYYDQIVEIRKNDEIVGYFSLKPVGQLQSYVASIREPQISSVSHWNLHIEGPNSYPSPDVYFDENGKSLLKFSHFALSKTIVKPNGWNPANWDWRYWFIGQQPEIPEFTLLGNAEKPEDCN